MDSLKLLSRSTKLKSTSSGRQAAPIPSSGQSKTPQLYPARQDANGTTSRKRKRGPVASNVNFFGSAVQGAHMENDTSVNAEEPNGFDNDRGDGAEAETFSTAIEELSPDEIKTLLKQHKLKITWLNAPDQPSVSRGKGQGRGETKKAAKPQVYPTPVQSFDHLRQRFGISSKLAENVVDQGYAIPTEVQLGALPLLLEAPSKYLERGTDGPASNGPATYGPGIDLLVVAPTGSGKSLAFILPLIHHLQLSRRIGTVTTSGTSAIILAPTKELASQLTNEFRKLAKGTGIKGSLMSKGMRLWGVGGLKDSTTNDHIGQEGHVIPAVKADVIVSTPGMLLHGLTSEDHIANAADLAGVKHLVLDEADVLLDPLFRDQTLAIFDALHNADLRVSLWSATMGSNVEEMARATLDDRRQRLSEIGNGPVPEAPLLRLVVGLKDSAVPNVHHKLVYAATEQGKLMGLRQLIHPASTSAESGPALRPPFLVFTQTIERATALHSELLYDIPAEAGGISRIAVLHSTLSDTTRDRVMTRFRKGEVWVLITTDLLSRSVDFRGINGVVNYDIPTSSAAYVHRVGRTGRAGREGGVAVTLYSKEDVPFLKHVVNVVAMAQKQNGALDGSGEDGSQQWLLDALPRLNKNDKQKLKQHGVESRNARGKKVDRKAARRSRISTKSGFVRRSENNRKAAVLASKRRSQMEGGDETEFDGFD